MLVDRPVCKLPFGKYDHDQAEELTEILFLPHGNKNIKPDSELPRIYK